ncbi:class I SAM-dependent RNA methyltransferase [Geoalkalibacter halelectricus]|uniref:Class I SAM-dependent RNA methyltransferase n=1 Tax=Geoalkalibacter halelectricus TaxID=2847045 RepID=A0ABY5ZQB2_9BACT|nr:class I SAM-dependent RNA methyltransferase [Geoalkalibacter halelectricus]MDO3376688.1 class I SAM-dependent RNA methyltransferase [Geoalkalibacter halelectricus]UWZ81360.1 class I SAM-dependent RNA methyltransferase [Geoalkalibacter halelectricus]
MEACIRIESLAFGGSGVGRLGGKVVFVAGAVPGDEVRIRPVREKKHFMEAEILEVLVPSPDRRVPPCPVFGQCGGCQWQSLPYARQVFWKERIFADFLLRQVGVESQVMGSLLAAPNEWAYRSRVQFKCYQSPAGFVMGFYRRGSHFVIDVDHCPIAAAAINQALGLFRDWLSQSPCPEAIPQVDLAVDDEGQVAAIVHCLAADPRPLAAYLAPRVGEQGLALYVQTGRKHTLTQVQGPGRLCIHPLDASPLRLGYPVGGFAQVNLAQNRRLVAELLQAVGSPTGLRVLDLFCGMGNFSLPLAAAGAAVVGVEDFAPAIVQAEDNSLANGLTARFLCRPARQALTQDLLRERFDLVVLDPPRSGAREVIPELLRMRPERIVYISCDPATLARDLKPLVHNGYQVRGARGIDLFPQTYHLESLTCLHAC